METILAIQILEIKQKYVFLWHVLEANFNCYVVQLSNFSIRVAGWSLHFNSKHFRDFPKISKFPKILKQLVGQPGHSIYGDNNLIQLQLWLWNTWPKPGQVSLFSSKIEVVI